MDIDCLPKNRVIVRFKKIEGWRALKDRVHSVLVYEAWASFPPDTDLGLLQDTLEELLKD